MRSKRALISSRWCTCFTLHTSHLTPHTPHLTPHTSLLTPRTSHLAPHTSHLTPHNSHLAPHTSHLTPRTSHLTPRTSHLAPRISHLTPRTSHLAPHTSHLTPRTSHLTPACRKSLQYTTRPTCRACWTTSLMRSRSSVRHCITPLPHTTVKTTSKPKTPAKQQPNHFQTQNPCQTTTKPLSNPNPPLCSPSELM
jgi:hypothetical protein